VITGLDHVVILVGDIAAGEAAYETLFARAQAWRTAATALSACCSRSTT
jgi:hypothetical protein